MRKNIAVKSGTVKSSIISIVGFLALFALIVALIAASNVKPPINESVWQDNMAMGETESPKRHYVMYTDIMCPYCDVFTRATMNYAEQFADYLTENRILFEVRMTNMLAYSGSEYSDIAAEGAYCAADEGKFWDYYHAAIQKLWDDYHSKGIGDSKTSPKISDMTDEWWTSLAETAELSDGWANCVQSEQHTEDIYNATMKTSQVTNGLPYFDWNGTIFNGLPSYFESWEELKEFLDMGL